MTGGKGGDASVAGNGFAKGGTGGDAGFVPVKGGDGGSAHVAGDGIAIGGDGGSGPTPDGRGGRGTKGPMEIMGGPTFLWNAGAGGDGGNTVEYNRRIELLTRYRREYCVMFPRRAIEIDAGVLLIPMSWINKRLEEEGELWRVTVADGRYQLPDLTG